MNYTQNIEALRAERNQKLCEDWAAISQHTPLKPSRLMDELAVKYGISHQHVERILRAGGVYHSAKEFKEERRKND